LQLNGRRRGGKEVILENEVMRVEVEDTSVVQEDEDGERWEGEGREWHGVEETLEGGVDGEAWRPPRGGLSSASATPGGTMRIVPTAMPPRREE
jgi:hypothetical protein